jgi:hypothetical protein
MYNKIFTKILDSSIWLEPDATRIVWITMIAAMDETGFCQFAAIPNVARRANVTRKAATEAIRVLESPDKDSSDPEFEGRRIERVPGGWMVLNAEKYRAIVTRAVSQEKTRLRVQRHRQNKRVSGESNANVTLGIRHETPSETEAYTETKNPPMSPMGEFRNLVDMIVCAHPRSLERHLSASEVSPVDRVAVLTAAKHEASQAGVSVGAALEMILRLVEQQANESPPDQWKFFKEVPAYFAKYDYRTPPKGGTNGAFKGKTESSLDAAREAIRRIEADADCDAAGGPGYSQASEAGRRGLPSVRG